MGIGSMRSPRAARPGHAAWRRWRDCGRGARSQPRRAPDRLEGAAGRLPPNRRARAGERCGYRKSPVNGWCDYYGDLMTGQVSVDGRRLGITPEAWRTGPILSS
jgi:hypothetical protein